jgi:hypothetical protein
MIQRFKSALVAILVLTLLVGQPVSVNRAEAQVPTIDLSSLAKLKEMVGTVNQQLGQLNSIFNTVSQINRVIGMVGSGNIGGILSMLGLGNLAQCINAAQNLGNMGGSIQSIISGASSLSGCSSIVGLTGIRPSLPPISSYSSYSSSNPTFSGFFNSATQAMQAGQTMGGASSALQKGLYLDPQTYRGANAAQSIESMNAVRGIVARQSAVDAMAVGVQGRTLLGKAPNDIQTLSDNAKNAKTLRDDIGVNNAIMMKILETQQQILAQLSARNQMSGAQFIANDGHTYTQAPTSTGQ